MQKPGHTFSTSDKQSNLLSLELLRYFINMYFFWLNVSDSWLTFKWPCSSVLGHFNWDCFTSPYHIHLYDLSSSSSANILTGVLSETCSYYSEFPALAAFSRSVLSLCQELDLNIMCEKLSSSEIETHRSLNMPLSSPLHL